MASFWKKPGGREGSPTTFFSESQSDGAIGSGMSPLGKTASVSANGSVLLSHGPQGLSPDIHLKNPPCLKNYELSPSRIGHFKRRSRLSQNMKEVLNDRCARRHFLRFLEAEGAANLLQFWLDAESFRILTHTRLSSCSRQTCLRSVETGSETSKDDHRETAEAIESRTEPRLGSSTCLLGAKEMDADGLDWTATTAANVEERANAVETAIEPRNADDARTGFQKLHKSIGDDAVNIFAKYIAKDASHPIGVPDQLRDAVTGKICSEDGRVDPACFVSVQSFAYNILEKQYSSSFLQSLHYCRHQLDVLTNGTVSLMDVLYDETSLSFFMEFVEQEGQRDLVEFWLAADNFYRHLDGQNGSYNTEEAQQDAMVLYDKYFSLQATCPLEFSQVVRFEVEQNICREEGPLPTCFENAVHIVLTVLEKAYFGQFLGSQLYVKYLTELVNRVQTGCEKAQDRKKGSDASSEHSVQTLNTLLAMDGSQPGVPTRRILKKFDDDAMRIDTDLLVPDMLWKRPLAGKLRLGYVNGMGQFVAEFEPEPDKRRATGSILSKAVKKFVYKDEDKTKEEMALQVAQMIVQEVLSITLGGRMPQFCKS